jgi:hypothetical protein
LNWPRWFGWGKAPPTVTETVACRGICRRVRTNDPPEFQILDVLERGPTSQPDPSVGLGTHARALPSSTPSVVRRAEWSAFEP